MKRVGTWARDWWGTVATHIGSLLSNLAERERRSSHFEERDHIWVFVNDTCLRLRTHERNMTQLAKYISNTTCHPSFGYIREEDEGRFKFGSFFFVPKKQIASFHAKWSILVSVVCGWKWGSLFTKKIKGGGGSQKIVLWYVLFWMEHPNIST